MHGAAATLRHELIGLAGVFERNVYLVKRYIWWDLAFFLWTVANTLTIVFIAEGVEATGGQINVERTTTILLIGAVIYGTVRAILLFGVVALFFDLEMPDANFVAALVLLAIASISFTGIGMMTAVLPLISPEKGAQLGFVAQGMLLVVSGVYYPTSVLPEWMQWVSVISPATYALDGIREAILEGDGVTQMGDEIWPLLVIGAFAVPLGLLIFRLGERHAKQHGKLKRSG